MVGGGGGSLEVIEESKHVKKTCNYLVYRFKSIVGRC